MKPRHVPVRTCAGCREERPKRDLLRIVRTPAGAVVVDATGKIAGRGGYVCPQASCWEAARRGSLERVLKVALAPADLSAVDDYLASIAGSGVASGAVPN